MSVIGDFVRLSPETLEEVRRDPHTAYRRLAYFDVARRLDVGTNWHTLSILIRAAGLAVNPFASGARFPDDYHGWGKVEPISLTVDEVTQAAAELARVPFEALARHIDAVRREQQWAEPVDEEVAREVRDRAEPYYRQLVDFYQEAAKNRECTIFYAA